MARLVKELGGHLNVKMSSYQYRDPHVRDKTVFDCLNMGIPDLGKMVFTLLIGINS